MLAFYLVCTAYVGLTVHAATGMTLNANLNASTETVTVSGTVAGLASWVTLYIVSPSNRMEWIGSTGVVNSTYEISIKLNRTTSGGTYRVTAKAEGMSVPTQTTFELHSVPRYSGTISSEGQVMYTFIPDYDLTNMVVVAKGSNNCEVTVYNYSSQRYSSFRNDTW